MVSQHNHFRLEAKAGKDKWTAANLLRCEEHSLPFFAGPMFHPLYFQAVSSYTDFSKPAITATDGEEH